LKQAKEYGDLRRIPSTPRRATRQANVEARIFELEELMKTAVTIEKSADNAVVHVGSTVTFKKGARK